MTLLFFQRAYSNLNVNKLTNFNKLRWPSLHLYLRGKKRHICGHVIRPYLMEIYSRGSSFYRALLLLLLSVRLFTPECKQISALWYNMDVGTKWQLLEYTVSRATSDPVCIAT